MAKDQPTRQKAYIIPDNFIDEPRIINGMFRTRYFIEGAVLALFAAALALLIPISSWTIRLTVIIFCAAPFFVLGVAGISGDPVSVAVSNVTRWFKTKTVMLYDPKPRALIASPLDVMMSQPVARDQILDYIEKMRQSRLEKRLQQQYIEGETFRFVMDRDYARKYVDTTKSQGDFEENYYDIAFDMDDDDFVVELDTSETFNVPTIPEVSRSTARGTLEDIMTSHRVPSVEIQRHKHTELPEIGELLYGEEE